MELSKEQERELVEGHQRWCELQNLQMAIDMLEKVKARLVTLTPKHHLAVQMGTRLGVMAAAAAVTQTLDPKLLAFEQGNFAGACAEVGCPELFSNVYLAVKETSAGYRAMRDRERTRLRIRLEGGEIHTDASEDA